MYSCNDCNGWDCDSASTSSSSPSQIVRCCNNYSQNSCSNRNFQNSGVYQINLGNLAYPCGQMEDDLFYEDDCGCNNDDLGQCNRQPVKESAWSRRKRYSMRRAGTQNACMPPTMPVSEYQEAYQKCYRNYKRQGPGTVKTTSFSLNCRPPWNSSRYVAIKPYEETLDALEAKLRLLDMFEEECPLDMMFTENEKESQAYRQARSTDRRGDSSTGAFQPSDTCGGGCGVEYKARPTFEGPGGGGRIGLCLSNSRYNFGGGGEVFISRRQETCGGKREVVLVGKPPSRSMKKKCRRKQRGGVYMNGSQLELLEEESVLSHDADELLNDMWRKLESSSAHKFQCHLKPQD